MSRIWWITLPGSPEVVKNFGLGTYGPIRRPLGPRCWEGGESVIKLSYGSRRTVNVLPVAQRTNAFTPGEAFCFRFFPIRWATTVKVFHPVGLKKCWLSLPVTGPVIKRETALDGCWRKLRFIPMRGRPIPNVFTSIIGSHKRTERYFFNGLQIQLHTNWPESWVLV